MCSAFRIHTHFQQEMHFLVVFLDLDSRTNNSKRTLENPDSEHEEKRCFTQCFVSAFVFLFKNQTRRTKDIFVFSFFRNKSITEEQGEQRHGFFSQLGLRHGEIVLLLR